MFTEKRETGINYFHNKKMLRYEDLQIVIIVIITI